MTWYHYIFGFAGWALFGYQRYLAGGWRATALRWKGAAEQAQGHAKRAQDHCDEALKMAMEAGLRMMVTEKEATILRRELCREKGLTEDRLPGYLIAADARWRAEQEGKPLDRAVVRKGKLEDK